MKQNKITYSSGSGVVDRYMEAQFVEERNNRLQSVRDHGDGFCYLTLFPAAEHDLVSCLGPRVTVERLSMFSSMINIMCFDRRLHVVRKDTGFHLFEGDSVDPVDAEPAYAVIKPILDSVKGWVVPDSDMVVGGFFPTRSPVRDATGSGVTRPEIARRVLGRSLGDDVDVICFPSYDMSFDSLLAKSRDASRSVDSEMWLDGVPEDREVGKFCVSEMHAMTLFVVPVRAGVGTRNGVQIGSSLCNDEFVIVAKPRGSPPLYYDRKAYREAVGAEKILVRKLSIRSAQNWYYERFDGLLHTAGMFESDRVLLSYFPSKHWNSSTCGTRDAVNVNKPTVFGMGTGGKRVVERFRSDRSVVIAEACTSSGYECELGAVGRFGWGKVAILSNRSAVQVHAQSVGAGLWLHPVGVVQGILAAPGCDANFQVVDYQSVRSDVLRPTQLISPLDSFYWQLGCESQDTFSGFRERFDSYFRAGSQDESSAMFRGMISMSAIRLSLSSAKFYDMFSLSAAPAGGVLPRALRKSVFSIRFYTEYVKRAVSAQLPAGFVAYVINLLGPSEALDLLSFVNSVDKFPEVRLSTSGLKGRPGSITCGEVVSYLEAATAVGHCGHAAFIVLNACALLTAPVAVYRIALVKWASAIPGAG